MKYFNRMLAFDEKSGQLIAEAGVMLADVIEVFLERGWFPAVTPGKFVTLGGMIAADVHRAITIKMAASEGMLIGL